MTRDCVSVSGVLLGVCLFSHAAKADPFTNGGFESPVLAGFGPRFTLFKEALVPGWSTTDTRGDIELWTDGWENVPAYNGRQFAEINSNSEATLFQTVTGLAAGSIVYVGFAHRGRVGIDNMELVVTDPGADGVLRSSDDRILLRRAYQADPTGWRYNTAWFTTTSNPFLISFNSLQTAGPSFYGNFLDAVTLFELPVAPLMRGADSLRANLQARLENAASYECRRFDRNGFCVAGGVRTSNVDSRSSGAGWLTLAWRPAAMAQVGAFVETSEVASGLTQFNRSTRLPLLGLYAALGDVSGLGWQAQAHAATQRDKLEINGGGASASEATRMTGFGFGARLGYGVGLDNGWMLTPGVSLQRISTTRKAYGETRSDVEGSNSLSYTYADYGLTRSVARIGATVSGALSEKVHARFAAGLSKTIAGRADDFTIVVDNGDRIVTPGARLNRAVRPYAEAGLGYLPGANVEWRLTYSVFAAADGAARYAQVGTFGVSKGF